MAPGTILANPFRRECGLAGLSKDNLNLYLSKINKTNRGKVFLTSGRRGEHVIQWPRTAAAGTQTTQK